MRKINPSFIWLNFILVYIPTSSTIAIVVVVINGTLKSDESKVNSLSEFSRKARKKGTRDISVLFAFGLEAMEPVCSQCFPGNMLDETSYENFIRENGITKGIIVADKGFPEAMAHEEFRKNPDLHCLNPIKSEAAALFRSYRLTDWESSTQKLCEKNAVAEGVANVKFAHGDATKLPFPNETFDAVTSNYVYHNISGHTKQELLLETFRVLKKGGTFAIHDLMSPRRYGDRNAFIQKLKDMGCTEVHLISTTDGRFMTKRQSFQ